MLSNVIGRVTNTDLPKKHALLPLFEAISNSFDAIDELHSDLSDGRIEIYIDRAQLELPDLVTDTEDILSPISSFEIHDNGIGFNDRNFESFNEADSLYKMARGGKGIGRFIWLKAFEKAKIESVFKQNGQTYSRSFTFSDIVREGVSDHILTECDANHPAGTIVRLLNIKSAYQHQQSLPKSIGKIGQRIIEHFLAYFMAGQVPEITLFDRLNQEELLLDDLYENLTPKKTIKTLEIDGHKFEIAHFFLQASSGLKHHICYCGGRRVVQKDHIDGKLSHLPPVLTDEDGDELIYAGYVFSPFLDQRVNQQRYGFNLWPDDGLEMPGELKFSQIEKGVLSSAHEVLQPYTEIVRCKVEDRVQKFVDTVAPEYRFLVNKHPEVLERIPLDISDSKLDAKLLEFQREKETELKEPARVLMQGGNPFDQDEAKFEERFSKWWEDYNEAGKAGLAKYITHRKWTLNVLEKLIKRGSNGKYSVEELVHQIIFPLKHTSDDITFDQHNLWIIDEKLSYHEYLSSDISLKRVPRVESTSDLRPDLLIFFEQAFVVVNDEPPYSSGIVIFEFKRPMRDDYDEKENPIQQVINYVDEIRSGSTLTKDGRPLEIPSSATIYCYIICDIGPKMKKLALKNDFKPTPDNCGYFKHHEHYGAYIEIIGFDKLITDAKKRNRILFTKLNLPDTLMDANE